MEQAIFNRELSVLELLGEGLRRFFGNIIGVLFIILSTSLPPILFWMLLSAGLPGLVSVASPLLEKIDAFRSLVYFFSSILSLIASLMLPVFQLWAVLAVARLVEEDISGRNPDWKKALTQSAQRLIPAIGTILRMGFFLFLLTLLLIVPGVVNFYYWVFSPCASALREMNPGEAMDHSKSLVQDRWWQTSAVVFIFLILAALLFIGILAAGIALASFASAGYFLIAASAFATALLTVWMTVFFLNLDHLGPAHNPA